MTRAKGICHFKFTNSTKSFQKAKTIYVPILLKNLKGRLTSQHCSMLATANLRGKMKTHFTFVLLCVLPIVTELLTTCPKFIIYISIIHGWKYKFIIHHLYFFCELAVHNFCAFSIVYLLLINL